MLAMLEKKVRVSEDRGITETEWINLICSRLENFCQMIYRWILFVEIVQIYKGYSSNRSALPYQNIVI
jgi:hypothetical protein